jgi:hypothetical protein
MGLVNLPVNQNIWTIQCQIKEVLLYMNFCVIHKLNTAATQSGNINLEQHFWKWQFQYVIKFLATCSISNSMNTPSRYTLTRKQLNEIADQRHFSLWCDSHRQEVCLNHCHEIKTAAFTSPCDNSGSQTV